MSLLFETPPNVGEIDETLTTAEIVGALLKAPGQWARIRETAASDRNKLDAQAAAIRNGRYSVYQVERGSLTATVRKVGDVARLYARFDK